LQEQKQTEKSDTMKIPLIFVFIAMIFLAGYSQPLEGDIIITNVHIIDVETGEVHDSKDVVIVGERIRSIVEHQNGRSYTGEVIDGSGRFLIPGLWDMHVHASRSGRAAHFWPLFIAHGITGIRDMGSYADSLLYWRDQSEHPDAVAPRIEITSPFLAGNSPPPLPGMGGPFGIRVDEAKSAVALVDSFAKQGLTVIKVYDGLPREAFFAVADRTQELGISFVGHVPHSVTLSEASQTGQKSFEHVTDLWASCVVGGRKAMADFAWAAARYGITSDSAITAREHLFGILAFSHPDTTNCGPLLELMQANGTWLTPTLTLLLGELQPRRFDGDPRMRWVPHSIQELWNARPRMPAGQEASIGQQVLANAKRTVAIAYNAGVPILAGTDASGMPYIFAGASLHDELALLVEAGLTSLQALQAATINPARFFKRTDELGTVEEGKLADLVLLDACPIHDITNTQRIRAVIADGQLYRRTDLDRLLAEVEATVKKTDTQE
jgi:hypothetical protein